LALSRDLVDLAAKGEADTDDVGCCTLYGVIRDCGYRIRECASRQQKLVARRELGSSLRMKKG
jgi:hypothetical protein